MNCSIILALKEWASRDAHWIVCGSVEQLHTPCQVLQLCAQTACHAHDVTYVIIDVRAVNSRCGGFHLCGRHGLLLGGQDSIGWKEKGMTSRPQGQSAGDH